MPYKTSKPTDKGIDRRTFMSRSACGAMGITALVNSLAHLRLIQAAMASGEPVGGNDYKALVVVFLFGGNDSNNMLIPTINHPQRADYDAGRAVLSISDGNLAKLQGWDETGAPVAPGAEQYGVHPNFGANSGTNNNPGPQALYNAGELGFVANVGTLVEPFHTDINTFEAEALPNFQSGNFAKPPQLYSHSDQQVQMQSSVPDQPYQTGWGGRAADLLNASYNAGGNVSMNIALNGVNKLQVGTAGGVSQYIVTSNGASSLSGFGTNYSSAATLNPDGSVASYKPNSAGKRLEGFDKIMRHTHDNLLEQGYNEVMQRSRDNEVFINTALLEAANSGVDFNAIFDGEDHDLGNELKMVAQLIAGRNCFGNQRQIFFVSTDGYDNHQNMLTAHGNRMSDLGGALAAFNEAMHQLGVHDNVLTLSQSDFTRTFTPNRTDPATAGSDHGYGGHQIVMGGPVQGGRVYGRFPTFKIGNVAGSIDTSGTRGRWIPSTSTDQYLAVAADWFGIARGSSEMETIFPNLGRFDDPWTGASNLFYTA
ncbi:hypothetical protein HAHE_19820 [Haloferula helveola]|uniref:DUF1501 domain-containing protein n=1 Tax=Haloferula helveola TaxID=490095 RepID=A0ABM7RDC9_9BACT|nr:hypothetical protein HAHE_19820 [Haloferula helveola]